MKVASALNKNNMCRATDCRCPLCRGRAGGPVRCGATAAAGGAAAGCCLRHGAVAPAPRAWQQLVQGEGRAGGWWEPPHRQSVPCRLSSAKLASICSLPLPATQLAHLTRPPRALPALCRNCCWGSCMPAWWPSPAPPIIPSTCPARGCCPWRWIWSCERSGAQLWESREVAG